MTAVDTHCTQPSSLLGRWFCTTYSSLPHPLLSDRSFATPPPCTPLAQGLSEPNPSPQCTLSSNGVFPIPLCLRASSLTTEDSSKGKKELRLHLILTLPLCCDCERGCSFMPAVKAALCCGYTSTRNQTEAANGFTKARAELLDAKGFQPVLAWIRYRLAASRCMAPISHYQFPWAAQSPMVKALI